MQNPNHETPAHALTLVLEYLNNGTAPGSDFCIALDYNRLIDLDREVELNSTTAVMGIRQLTYIYCTQLGWHHTSDSPRQPFGNRFPVEFELEACESVFEEV